MYSNFKKKSLFHKFLDKWQRRNKGHIYILIINYFAYFKYKLFFNTQLSRGHILKQIKNNSVVAELGVWKGDFSKKIFEYCVPKELILVDSWVYDVKIRGCAPQVHGIEPLNQKYFDEAYKETQKKFENYSNVLIYKHKSKQASELIEDNYFDFLYIDAEHSYKAVTEDLKYWYPKLKKNGYIFGDDYYWRETDGSFSVEKAYQDFFRKHNIKYWCVFKSQVCFKKL